MIKEFLKIQRKKKSMKKDIAIIILAAGKSTRMNSDTPKVLHQLCGRPMIGYVLDLAKSLKAKKTVAVLGYKQELVRKSIPAYVKIAAQKKLIGTANAVEAGLKQLKGFSGTVLVLYGDNPLLKKPSIDKLLDYHILNNVDATLLSAQLDKPAGYGRIKRDKLFSVCQIVEENQADEVEKDLKEVNTGIVAFKADSLKRCLKLIRPNNPKKEYYLTDIINIFYKSGLLVDAIKLADINEGMGVNSRLELSQANRIMQKRINDDLMKQGVTLIDPGSTFINFGTKIGSDTVIYPFTVIERDVKIGKRCSLGPFAHLRAGVKIDNDVVAGNFIEMARSRIGAGSFVKHFSYIGDSWLGKAVNIGAGTVTANFDGLNKHNTTIKDHTCIGSHTVIVAPVKIGRQAITGAGSVVINDIPDKATAVGMPARIIKKKR
jgi:bifunctional UDP-N-acetylglucosamine pyrophosphorylase/glucosamine-1-phosphate N-acetyltransferase